MKLNISLPPAATNAIKQIGRYKVIIVLVVVASLYGYLVMQVNSAVNVEPNAEEIVAVKKSTPRIDPDTVKQLKELQDNSVSVQALFNEARTNPFQ